MAVLTVNNQLHNTLKECCKFKTSKCDIRKCQNHRSQTNHWPLKIAAVKYNSFQESSTSDHAMIELFVARDQIEELSK